jgi:hypothetical protein
MNTLEEKRGRYRSLRREAEMYGLSPQTFDILVQDVFERMMEYHKKNSCEPLPLKEDVYLEAASEVSYSVKPEEDYGPSYGQAMARDYYER